MMQYRKDGFQSSGQANHLERFKLGERRQFGGRIEGAVGPIELQGEERWESEEVVIFETSEKCMSDSERNITDNTR